MQLWNKEPRTINGGTTMKMKLMATAAAALFMLTSPSY